MKNEEQIRDLLKELEEQNAEMHKTQREEDIDKCRANNSKIATLRWVLGELGLRK